MAVIKEVGPRKKLHAEFNSVPEVFRVIDRLNWVPQNSKSSDKYEGSDFHTFQSLAEARDVFENHPERIRQFSQNDDKLVTLESPGKDVEYDVTGDFLDIDRYLEGIPEVFGNAVMGNPKSIFCTINVLNSFVSYTSPKYQVEKQKRILRLVDWLENQGIRCQIVLSEDSYVSYSTIVVKEFQDPFDLNHLAVAMHPDWLRRIMFLIMEQSKTWEHGYGSSNEYDARMKKYVSQPEDGLYVYVGGYLPYGGYQNGKAEGINALNKAFDKIEENVVQTIDDGLSFNQMPLVIGGEKSPW
jgi:hypothetical protein